MSASDDKLPDDRAEASGPERRDGPRAVATPVAREGGDRAAISLASRSPQPSIRVGGSPAARGLPAPDGDALRTLERLSRDITELKSSMERGADAPPAAAETPQLAKSLEEIRNSIAYLEAFLSITLMGKLNEIVSEKLTVLRDTVVAQHRLKRTRALSLALNVVLVCLLVLEARTGMVSAWSAAFADGILPQLRSLARGVAGLVAAAGEALGGG